MLIHRVLYRFHPHTNFSLKRLYLQMFSKNAIFKADLDAFGKWSKILFEVSISQLAFRKGTKKKVLCVNSKTGRTLLDVVAMTEYFIKI